MRPSWGLYAAVLALAAPNGARAHLGSPFADAAGDLARAPQVAVVRVVEETRIESDGAVTDVERVAAIVGQVPARFRMRQPGPHLHRLARGEVVLAPLSPLPGRADLHYTLQTQTALDAEREPVEGLRQVVRGWRFLPQPAPAGLRVRHAASRAGDPSPLARRLVLEQLLVDPRTLASALDEASLVGLVATVARDDLPAAYRQGLVRALDLSGHPAALVALCRSAPALRPPAVRATVYESLSARGGPCIETELARCVSDPSDPLRSRCAALGGTPRVAGAP